MRPDHDEVHAHLPADASESEARTDDGARGLAAAQANAGTAALGRILEADGAAEVFAAGTAEAVALRLRSAATAFRLRDLVRGLDHGQHGRLVQPALRTAASMVGPSLFPALQQIFDGSNPAEPGTMRICFALRFALRLGAGWSVPGQAQWTPNGLARAWRVLERLPQRHVMQNEFLDAMLRTTKPLSGEYANGTVQLGYTDDDQLDLFVEYAATGEHAQRAVQWFNFFDAAVRHEVGHAVDDALMISSRYGATAAGGGWRSFDGRTAKGVGELLAACGVTGLAPDRMAALTSLLVQYIDGGAVDLAGFELASSDLVNQPFWPCLREQVAGLKDDLAGNAGHRTPTPVEGRCYVASYPGMLSSFDVTAYARRVRNYQFRAPGEWFAEAYAAYHDPQRPGGGALSSRDPETFRYIRTYVEPNAARLDRAYLAAPREKDPIG